MVVALSVSAVAIGGLTKVLGHDCARSNNGDFILI
jgi:hypothetical protein